MHELKQFVTSIPDFLNLSSAKHIDCFSYFLIENFSYDGVRPADINKCFDELKLPPYSNIPSYFNKNSKRINKKKVKYFVKNGKYHLTPFAVNDIQLKILNLPKKIEPTNSLFPMEIFTDSRKYIQEIAVQAATCYDFKLYDACNVMLRRLMETLIIETFERKKMVNKVKDKNDNFYYMRDLISILVSEKTLNISRNSKQGLSKLKNLGDMSAHNRRFLAKKTDIDEKKEILRIVVEELMHIINYPTWKD
jgi:hypothetical protein